MQILRSRWDIKSEVDAYHDHGQENRDHEAIPGMTFMVVQYIYV